MIDAHRMIDAISADFYCVPPPALRHEARGRKDICQARHVAMWVTRRFLGWSTTRIGRSYGRDHTSVIHALARIDRQIADGGDAAAEAFCVERRVAKVLRIAGAVEPSVIEEIALMRERLLADPALEPPAFSRDSTIAEAARLVLAIEALDKEERAFVEPLGLPPVEGRPGHADQA